MVARFHPSDPRVVKVSSKEFTGSVPVEQILQLAGDLAAHLLAMVPGDSAQPQQNDGEPGRRADSAANRRGKAGKKRAKKAPPAPESNSADLQVGGAGGGLYDDSPFPSCSAFSGMDDCAASSRS